MEGGSVGHNFERDPEGFRGEDLNVKVYDVRRRTPSDGKSSLGLWPGELKMKFSPIFIYMYIHYQPFE